MSAHFGPPPPFNLALSDPEAGRIPAKAGASRWNELELTLLTVEREQRPLAIATATPLFGWVVPAGRRQRAYCLRVFEGQREIWSSGRVESALSVDVRFQGEPLASDTDFRWSVAVWTDSGETLEADSMFGTALLRDGELRASWVLPTQERTFIERYTIPQILAGEAQSPVPLAERLRPPQHVRQEISLEEPPVRARLFASARGVYSLHLNGVAGGDAVLAPGFDSYTTRTSVQCHDVTTLLKAGNNELVMTVADGWYAGRVGMSGSSAPFGDELAVLWQLSLLDSSGEQRTLASGDVPSFSTRGAWDYSDLFIGEQFDARRVRDGRSWPSPRDPAWGPCERRDADPTILVPSSDAPVRCTQTLPCEITEEPHGWLVDAGQVIAGRLRIRVTAPAGAHITIEHSEVMTPDGEFFDNILGPNKDQRDVYIAAGMGSEEYEPAFTLHGFRFARLTADLPFTLERADAVVLGSDLSVTSTFHTSDSRLKRLHENIVWSQRGNFLSIPTDCPQRERVGWTGDIQIFAPSATNNMDVRSFLERWLANLRADQLSDGAVPQVVPAVPTNLPPVEDDVRGAAGWGDAIVTVPWILYQRYGDERVLRENFDAMLRWIEYQQVEAKNHLPTRLDRAALSANARQRHSTMWNTGWQSGDWLAPSVVRQGHDPVQMAMPSLSSEIVTAMHHANSTRLVAQIAEVLGDHAASGDLSTRADRIARAFADEYIDERGHLPVDLQGHYVLAIAFDLVPADRRQGAIARLVELIHAADDHLDTGFLSTPHLLDVLWDAGEHDLARRLLFQDTSPSWLYPLTHGATTVWESWEAVLPDGTPTHSSMNHYAFGCVDDWLFRRIGGLESTAPGFAEFRVAPDVYGDVASSDASVQTVRGPARVRWEREGTTLALTIAVPSGARARVEIGNSVDIVPTGTHQLTYELERNTQ